VKNTFKLIAILALVVFLFAGVKRALPKYNSPSDYKIRLVAKEAAEYSIFIRGADYSTNIAVNHAQVEVHIPRLPRGVCWDLYGLTVIDGSPENFKSIFVMQGTNVVRSLTLKEIKKLPLDKDGFVLLVL